MVMVSAFRGVRYNSDKIEDLSSVLAPPYDVISPDEQNKLYEKSPHNVIRLILSKGETDEKYIQANETFTKWIGEEVLIQDSEPCIYPYYQEFEEGGKTLTRKGFIAAVRLEDFSSKKILPHERTFPKYKLDRLKLTTACKANLSPVFAIYSDPEGSLQRSIEQKLYHMPIVEAIGTDGVKSRLWRVSDSGLISEIKSYMLNRNLLIADGHHRYETALEYRDIQRKKSGTNSGNMPYEYVLMYLCRGEDEGLVIKPTHRVVKNLGNLQVEDFLKKLSEKFNAKKVSFNEGIWALSPREFAVFTGDSDFVFKVFLKQPLPISYNNLGVMLLHKLVFGEILSEDEAQLLYTKSLDEVTNLVRSGEYKLGFILPTLSALDIFEVSMANEKMPHKTTYFYPKLLSGLIFHLLD
jgi:uncharacterized protein (DUF1015 family)